MYEDLEREILKHAANLSDTVWIDAWVNDVRRHIHGEPIEQITGVRYNQVSPTTIVWK